MRAADLTLAEQISLLSGSTFWLTQPLPDRGIGSVMLSDGPHGLRAQKGEGEHLGLTDSLPATCFPTAVTIASSWDVELIEQIGAAVGREARAIGVSVVLGPGLNIKRHPLCGRNFEYLSEDPLLSGVLAAAMVRGIQGQGVGACLKHFAVNNQESHRLVVDAVVDERTLREIYLAGFEYAVTHASPQTIMAAYNLVNGQYCCDSEYLLTGILRQEWGFDGLVMSDWGATNDRAAGVRAGMDLEMPGSGGVFDAEVAQAVAGGELDPADVARCADRVLDLVAGAPVGEGPAADLTAHNELARRAAAESTVLLANDGILPLAGDETVALIGAFARQPRYQGSGSSQVNPTRLTTAANAFTERGVRVRYAAGYDPVTCEPDENLIAEAVAVAARADVVVLMAGLPGIYESEGFDRTDLHLPRQQEQLIHAVCAANPRTVVALSNGAPVVMPWVDQPAAILESYLGGQASGGALVDVLYGQVEPAGRLAETFPVQQTDVASDNWFPGQPHQVQYREGLAVGYRHFTTSGTKPLFPFGHGLGYSTFELGEPALDDAEVAAGQDVTIRVPVTNTGQRDGSTVIQVYVHDRTGRVARPRRELGGFAKVRLPAGATDAVVINVPSRAFAFYDVQQRSWQVPEGEYDLEVGLSSVDIAHAVPVRMTGGFTGRRDEEAGIASDDGDFARRLGRPIPPVRPVRPYTRVSTVGEVSHNPVGQLLRSLVLRVGGHHTAEDPTTARMIERSVDEMPLRTIALFSEGKIDLGVIDALIDVLNRRPDRTVGRAVRGLLRKARGG
ncbi:MAG TPA: glycoside hydrolase family 3 C-terminal domain-containing protein [Actinomycetota bacterium]|nr:glycoside hydrolase family 3 C-terminal domain-containing protein [Actinomycetota bacterium]